MYSFELRYLERRGGEALQLHFKDSSETTLKPFDSYLLKKQCDIIIMYVLTLFSLLLCNPIRGCKDEDYCP